MAIFGYWLIAISQLLMSLWLQHTCRMTSSVDCAILLLLTLAHCSRLWLFLENDSLRFRNCWCRCDCDIHACWPHRLVSQYLYCGFRRIATYFCWLRIYFWTMTHCNLHGHIFGSTLFHGPLILDHTILVFGGVHSHNFWHKFIKFWSVLWALDLNRSAFLCVGFHFRSWIGCIG